VKYIPLEPDFNNPNWLEDGLRHLAQWQIQTMNPQFICDPKTAPLHELLYLTLGEPKPSESETPKESDQE
jgi:hypothetical protein